MWAKGTGDPWNCLQGAPAPLEVWWPWLLRAPVSQLGWLERPEAGCVSGSCAWDSRLSYREKLLISGRHKALGAGWRPWEGMYGTDIVPALSMPIQCLVG